MGYAGVQAMENKCFAAYFHRYVKLEVLRLWKLKPYSGFPDFCVYDSRLCFKTEFPRGNACHASESGCATPAVSAHLCPAAIGIEKMPFEIRPAGILNYYESVCSHSKLTPAQTYSQIRPLGVF